VTRDIPIIALSAHAMAGKTREVLVCVLTRSADQLRWLFENPPHRILTLSFLALDRMLARSLAREEHPFVN